MHSSWKEYSLCGRGFRAADSRLYLKGDWIGVLWASSSHRKLHLAPGHETVHSKAKKDSIVGSEMDFVNLIAKKGPDGILYYENAIMPTTKVRSMSDDVVLMWMDWYSVIMLIFDRDNFVKNSVNYCATPYLHISAPPIGLDTVLTMNVKFVSSQY